jgi:anti-sigma factor RsiW
MSVSGHPSERLVPYLRNELAAAERAAVEAHVEGCADCRAALADFAALAERLARAPEPAPSIHWGAFRAELREALARRAGAPGRPRRWSLGPLPAALAAGLAAIVLYLAMPGQNLRAPGGDQALVEDAMLASRLDLIKELDLVQRLDLLEDFDVIGRLDRLEPSSQG